MLTSSWEDDETYQEAPKMVRGLAQEDVALIHGFNRKLANSKEELQFLLHVISKQ